MENINLDRIIKADELDTNMILSVPEEIGLKLQRIIQGQAQSQEKNETNIELIENPNCCVDTDESRKMIFKLNEVLLPITILDFPCIIEAQKTIDNKTFYKSGDISQMMFVHDKEFALTHEDEISTFNPFKSGDETFNRIVWRKDYDNKYKLKSGLGRATRNIRSKRFKRKIRYNGEEILDVAKKLKTIIDNGAANYENLMKNKESVIEAENTSIIHSNSELVRESSNLHLGSSIVIPMINEAKDSKLATKKRNDEFNAPISKNKNLSISIAKTEIVEQPKLTAEQAVLLEEYNFLKNEYKKLKKELEKNDDAEKARKKKKIKKRLKEIKSIFPDNQDNDDDDEKD
jgi:TATA-binding protein-associated factor Taf7